MNIIKSIINMKNSKEYKEQKNEIRYEFESSLIGILSRYALNKEKNIIKPKFEGLELIDIFTHLMSEVHEVKNELNQSKVDYEKVLDEIADCAALLTGLVAYIIEHKDHVLEE